MNFRTIAKQILVPLALSQLLIAPAFALELGDAKSRGLVGETNGGYIAAIKSSAEVVTLVESVNSQRKSYYKKLAEKNNISLEAVEVRAGQKAITKTLSGNYINSGNGWQKK